MNRWDDAAEDYLKVVELQPDWPEFHNDAVWLLANNPDPRRRDPGRAVSLALKAIELEPDEPAYWNTLGVAQYRAGDWKRATAALEKAHVLKGEDPYDGFFLAMSRWQLGERKEALALYAEALCWMEKYRPNDDQLRRICAEAQELLRVKLESTSMADLKLR
jgi:tetratricopeptide (TPR) repeat protein